MAKDTVNTPDFISDAAVSQGTAPVSFDASAPTFIPDKPENPDFIPDEAPTAPSRAEPPAKGTIRKQEIEEIAAKHKVSPDMLRTFAPLMGVSVEDEGAIKDVALRAGGVASEGALLGLPTWAAKKMMGKQGEEAVDELRALVEQRKTGLEKGAEIAAGLVPAILAPETAAGTALKEAGILGKTAAGAATGAAYGAAGGLATSKRGEELTGAAEGAMTGTLLGGAVGAVGGALTRTATTVVDREAGRMAAVEQRVQELAANPIQQIAVANAEQVAREGTLATAYQLTPEAVASVKRIPPLVSQKFGEDLEGAKQYVAKQRVDRDIKDFLLFVNNRSSMSEKQFERAAQSLSQQVDVGKAYDLYLRDKATKALLKERVIDKVPTARDFVYRAALFLSDSRNGAAGILDAKHDLGWTQALDEGSSSYNKMVGKIAAESANEEILAAKKFYRELPQERQDAIAAALRTGEMGTLSQEEQSAATTFKDSFKRQIDEAEKEFNLRVTKQANYLPETLAAPEQLSARVQSRVDRFGGIEAVKQGMLNAAEDDTTFAELKQGIEFLSGRKIKDAASFDAAFGTALNPSRIEDKINSKARFLLEKEGTIPEWLRENNVANLHDMWTSTTWRHLYMRDLFLAARANSAYVTKVGDKSSADYFNNYIKDQLGLRQGSPTYWFREQRLAWQKTMLAKAEKAEGLAKDFYQVAAGLPEMWTVMQRQMYPAFLGWSPKAVLMHAAQPALMTVPEVGWAYGTQKLMSAYGALAKALVGMETPGQTVILRGAAAGMHGVAEGAEVALGSWTRRLIALGKMAPHWDQESVRALREGLNAYAPWRMGTAALEKFNNASMWLFEKNVMIGRAANNLMAVGIAQDLLGHGSPAQLKAAMKFVNSMDGAYRRGITEAVAQGNSAEATRLLSNYLIGKTMFNFNRITMSEYGRFMGPMFSAFTKWPTSIAGDMLSEVYRRGAVGGLSEAGRKYLTPMALLYAAHSSIRDEVKDNPLYEASFGHEGLPHIAPAGAAMGVLSGEFAQPPAIKAGLDIAKALATADLNKMYHALNTSFNAFTPFIPSLARTFVHLESISEGTPVPRGTLLNQVSESLGEGSPDKAVRDMTKSVTDELYGR